MPAKAKVVDLSIQTIIIDGIGSLLLVLHKIHGIHTSSQHSSPCAQSPSKIHLFCPFLKPAKIIDLSIQTIVVHYSEVFMILWDFGFRD